MAYENMAAPETTPIIVARATSTLPQTAQTPYFTVTGRVQVIRLVGEVTVEIGADANNFDLRANPAVGADVALCTATACEGDAVGTLYTITGDFSDALQVQTSGAIESPMLIANGIIVSAGSIDLKTSASKAGQTKRTLTYIALDAGAKVTAA